MATDMAEQLKKGLSCLARMEDETVKASTLKDVVADAVKQSMAVFTERLEKTERILQNYRQVSKIYNQRYPR